MSIIISPVILWIARLIIVFPLFASNIKAHLKENKGQLPASLKIMRLHILVASFLELIMTILSLSNKNNMLFAHMYVIEEFVMDMLFYRELLKKTDFYKDEPAKRKVFMVAIAVFVAFAVVNAAFITDTNHFPIYTFVIQCMVMIVCTTQYAVVIIKSTTRHYYLLGYGGPLPNGYAKIPTFNLYKSPVFWMNMGKLIYFISALPLFILFNIVMENGQQSMALLIWRIQDIALIVLHIFMGIGFLKFTGNVLKPA